MRTTPELDAEIVAAREALHDTRRSTCADAAVASITGFATTVGGLVDVAGSTGCGRRFGGRGDGVPDRRAAGHGA
jgi:hypothetical protein